MSLEVLAIIPAGSGSKSISGKDIRSQGEALMTCSFAYEIKCITSVIVSTCSEYYFRLANALATWTPFLYAAEIFSDEATDENPEKKTLIKF